MPPILDLYGAPGSPYSRKMRAVLRYRRIPHRWKIRTGGDGAPRVPVALIPILAFSPDDAMIDSTFQIRRLEQSVDGRSIVPPDPALAFLDFLIEDYADEWLTKAMFHYRWAFPPDIAKAGAVLPRWRGLQAPPDQLEAMSKMFCERQIGRLGVVGSNPTTAPVIEDSYRRLLNALEALLGQQPFVMGRRPGTSDFGLFGQLTQLAQFDPTPAAIALEEAPGVLAWCDLVEDLGGLEVDAADWTPREAVPETVDALLAEVGRVYAPFLLGNARAVEQGDEHVQCEIDGREWVQKPFPYQAKCLGWLREAHAALSAVDRGWVDARLAGTGCEALFS